MATPASTRCPRGEVKHELTGVRKRRRNQLRCGLASGPGSCQKDSLGQGQVQVGERVEAVGGLCDKRGLVAELARGEALVPRMRKEALLSAFTRTEREVVCIWPDTSAVTSCL